MAGMRLSEFWRLVGDEFGETSGRHLTATMSLTELGSRTADQALEDGEDPRRVWMALCGMKDVPPARQWGRDLPLRTERWDG